MELYLNNIKKVINRMANDIKAIANRVGNLERNLHYLTIWVSIEKSDPDASGYYRKVTHRRSDGTISQVSRIEHDPMLEIVNGIYNKRVTSLYAKDGIQITNSVSHHLKYDIHGVIVSETLLP